MKKISIVCANYGPNVMYGDQFDALISKTGCATIIDKDDLQWVIHENDYQIVDYVEDKAPQEIDLKSYTIDELKELKKLLTN